MRSTAAAFASGFGCVPGQSSARLPAASGHSCGAPGACVASIVDHRIERLVVDLDQIGGVLRRECGFRDHHRDRLADIHHALARQRMPVRHQQLAAVAARQRRMARHAADTGGVDIRGGHDRDHAAHFPGRVRVDAADAGMGVRRAHERRRGLTGLGGIGNEAAVAAHEIVVLDARMMMGVAVGLGVHGELPGVLCGSGYSANHTSGEGFRGAAQSARNALKIGSGQPWIRSIPRRGCRRRPSPR